MTDQFFIDPKAQAQLKKFYKKAPIAFQRTSAGVLSSMAAQSRTNAQKVLKRELTIRRPALLKTGLRFKLAKKNEPIRTQQSEVFSVKIGSFDGWESLESGKSSRVTMFTDKGRVGKNQKGVGKKEARAGQNHTVMSDYKLKGSGQSRTNLFLQSIGRDDKRRRKPFYLPKGYKGMRRGVYQFQGGRKGTFTSKGRKYKNTLIGAKIVRLSTPKDDMNPNKIGWMARAVRITTRPSRIKAMWVDNFEREVRKIKTK